MCEEWAKPASWQGSVATLTGVEANAKAVNWACGLLTPALFLAPLPFVLLALVWSWMAWTVHDWFWAASFAAVALLLIGLPVAFLSVYGRWQTNHGPHAAAPTSGTRVLNWACGLFAALLAFAVLPVALGVLYLAHGSLQMGDLVPAAFFAVTVLLLIGLPVAFLRSYDRWQTRNGLQ